MDLSFFLIVVSLCVVLILASLAWRSQGPSTQSEVRKRIKRLE